MSNSYPQFWPGTTIIKTHTTPFNWKSQPSLLPVESNQGKHPQKALLTRDNAGHAFMPAILSREDRDHAFRIGATS